MEEIVHLMVDRKQKEKQEGSRDKVSLRTHSQESRSSLLKFPEPSKIALSAGNQAFNDFVGNILYSSHRRAKHMSQCLRLRKG
jgi:hypothetical protein